MKISVSEAKACLTDLVRRVEAGEEVVLTRHGRDVVRLAPCAARVAIEDRRRILIGVRAAAQKATQGVRAARSQDFLYDRDGLPV